MQDPKYIELSHPITQGLKTYQGLPKPIICDYFAREETQSQYEDGSTFQISRTDMVGNTDTYMDCPFIDLRMVKILLRSDLLIW